MDQSFVELNQKIDLLTAQVAYLTEQAQIAARTREAIEDLGETAMPVAKDVMDIATRELEDVQEYLDLADLARLLKKVVRQTPNFEMLVEQLGGVIELFDVLGPIPMEVMTKVTKILDELDRKGYFALSQKGLKWRIVWSVLFPVKI